MTNPLLHVNIIQSDLVWENPQQNMIQFGKKIDSISDVTDIIVLPEMFPTGFTLNPETNFQEMNGEVVQWMKDKAKQKNCAITGSVIIKEKEQYFNRMIWMLPSGEFEYYDKKHLFRMSDEHHHYKSGNQKVIVNYKGWRIRLQICYDLRFPVWSRNRTDYDLMIYVANWPQSRSFAWKTLLTARAIENQTFVIGVNRIGYDNKNTAYSGDSLIIHPLGNTLFSANPSENQIGFATLNMQELQKLRESFPVHLDADDFLIQ